MIEKGLVYYLKTGVKIPYFVLLVFDYKTTMIIGLEPEYK